MRIRAFIQDLADADPGPAVFNPWSDPDCAHNLEQYLLQMWRGDGCGGLLLVGEALGYRGGRNTGIPFSSADLYRNPEHPFLQSLAPSLRLQRGPAEATATITWQCLMAHGAVPLFWNAFPWHPHAPHQPTSNRKPRRSEIELAQPFLRRLELLFRPRVIAGVGREGQAAAIAAFPGRRVEYIRHPSHGGKRAFIATLGPLLAANASAGP